MSQPEMLTIRQTAHTGILPEYALRALEKEGKLPGIKIGVKFYVNYTKLCELLNNQGQGDQIKAERYRGKGNDT